MRCFTIAIRRQCTAGPDPDLTADTLNLQTAENRVLGQSGWIECGFNIIAYEGPDREVFWGHGGFVRWLRAREWVCGAGISLANMAPASSNFFR